MKSLSNSIKAILKAVKHATLSHRNYKERWEAVRPDVINFARQYQALSRLHLAKELAKGGKVDYDPLVEAYTDVYLCFMELESSSHLSVLDHFKPALFNIGVRGLDGKVTYIDVHHIDGKSGEVEGEETGLRGILAQMPQEDLEFFVKQTLSQELNNLVPSALDHIGSSLNEMKFHGFNPAEDMTTKSSAVESIRKIVDKRAEGSPSRPPRKGAQNVMDKKIEKALAIVGSVGALCGVVLSVYARNQYYMETQIEKARENMEKSYLYHSAGGTTLVQSKDGERQGMHTGKNSGADVVERLVHASRMNSMELSDFMESVGQIMAPFLTVDLDVPMMWGEGGVVRFTVSQYDLALADEVRRFRDWVEDSSRIEYNHDQRVAVQFAHAENVRKNFDKEAFAKSLRG